MQKKVQRQSVTARAAKRRRPKHSQSTIDYEPEAKGAAKSEREVLEKVCDRLVDIEYELMELGPTSELAWSAHRIVGGVRACFRAEAPPPLPDIDRAADILLRATENLEEYPSARGRAALRAKTDVASALGQFAIEVARTKDDKWARQLLRNNLAWRLYMAAWEHLRPYFDVGKHGDVGLCLDAFMQETGAKPRDHPRRKPISADWTHLTLPGRKTPG